MTIDDFRVSMGLLPLEEAIKFMNERPNMVDIWMGLAEQLSRRSTCKRKQVGTVITNLDLDQVLAVGYNGNAKGFKNDCDSDEPGHCGCLHSEINALIKAGSREPKVVFVSMSPCKNCAKAMVNADVRRVWFRERYRDLTGLTILQNAGIEIQKYEVIGKWNLFNPEDWINGTKS